jgi:hypothetical protein
MGDGGSASSAAGAVRQAARAVGCGPGQASRPRDPMKRCKTLSLLRQLTAILLGMAGAAVAQSNDAERPIRHIHPAAAGDSSDATIRILSPILTKHLGSPISVDNQPGATRLQSSPPEAFRLSARLEVRRAARS